ncbi:unnamed protein product, partial [Rotaria sp. Silwood2]
PPLRAPSVDIHPNVTWSKNGVTVAGGNGRGNESNQLGGPRGLYVDDDQTVYVAAFFNNRIVEWKRGATRGKVQKQGIVVAGGQGTGNSLTQLTRPNGIVVDPSGTVYVADLWNNRIMRWPKRITQGTVIVSKNEGGAQSKQVYAPIGLSFDRQGNLYVVEYGYHRVQRYSLE